MINETLEADREYQKAIAEAKRQAIKSSDCIDRQAAIDALGDYMIGKRCPEDGTLTARLIENEVINKLPSAQLEIIPCDYVKACNEATNYKMISAVSYLEVLEELKKHGYVLVETIKER